MTTPEHYTLSIDCIFQMGLTRGCHTVLSFSLRLLMQMTQDSIIIMLVV